ncbi:hypothetical protein [Archangium sp.]|uniref:hypothetical protein n=1 Tax=Archangium sp. TaxID=1872627 RepID=UPI002D58EC01|nr:hypothetical protein [Archangium sp.]HYO51624.1 hypothetical protein [Archangium sp.]
MRILSHCPGPTRPGGGRMTVECYDAQLAARLDALIEERLSRSRLLTLEELNGRPLPIRLRDGVARLLSPYL